MTDIITKNQEETVMLGKKFASSLKGGEVVALYGDLGSGKTTFTSGVINYFLKTKRVLSPTFIIVRHYYPKTDKIDQIIHVDLYRLKKIIEIEDIGLTEFFNKPKILVLIEWADRMEKLLPKTRIDVDFKSLGAQKRSIKIKYNSSLI